LLIAAVASVVAPRHRSTSMADELEVLALQFARDALDKQDGILAELRARTGTLLAASSIVSSFLGATAIGRDGLSGWSIVALVALGASLALCVAILLPRSDLSFSIDGPRVYEELYDLRAILSRFTTDLRTTCAVATRTISGPSSGCSARSDSRVEHSRSNSRPGRSRSR
jgi:hypothetical protein